MHVIYVKQFEQSECECTIQNVIDTTKYVNTVLTKKKV